MRIYTILIVVLMFLGCKNSFSKKTKTIAKSSIRAQEQKKSIVFIAGYDQSDNTYYDNARKYFEAQNIKVVNELFSIAEIITYLNNDTIKAYDKIHMVSHSNSWLGMSLKTTNNGERITVKSITKAKEEHKIPSLNSSVTAATKIIFHSCGLGNNKELLKALKNIFTSKESPKIIASSYFNVFGGKFAGHYLAKPYYGYYPTAESSGPIALSKEFKANYPNENIDWLTALKTRKETTLGKVYSYKFNIPVDWEFTFDNKTEIPEFKGREAIMDWISESTEMSKTLYNLKIPIEKYRWKYKVEGNKLHIKGKTTVLCVLKPILQDNDPTEYKKTIFSDESLYQIL